MSRSANPGDLVAETRTAPKGSPVIPREPWLVWTERENEIPRRGHGDDALQQTLDHLRKRGDKIARVQLGNEVAVSEVRL